MGHLNDKADESNSQYWLRPLCLSNGRLPAFVDEERFLPCQGGSHEKAISGRADCGGTGRAGKDDVSRESGRPKVDAGSDSIAAVSVR